MSNPVGRRWFYLAKVLFVLWSIFWLLLAFGLLIEDLPWYGRLIAAVMLIITTPSGFSRLFKSYEDYVGSNDS
ncbi:MAG: hypothetical protein ACREK5_11500 [Gemmatimonadota bacterium]